MDNCTTFILLFNDIAYDNGEIKVLLHICATAGGQYKMMQKKLKLTETLAHWYSSERTQQKLSNEYQHDRV